MSNFMDNYVDVATRLTAALKKYGLNYAYKKHTRSNRDARQIVFYTLHRDRLARPD
jgi:hypothetical protein